MLPATAVLQLEPVCCIYNVYRTVIITNTELLCDWMKLQTVAFVVAAVV